MAGRSKMLLLAFAAFASLAGGVWAWKRAHPSPTTSPAAVPPDIPAVVVDDEVRTALVNARARILAQPDSSEAWSDFGLLFRSHQIMPQADACFMEAAKLDPNNPRWPFLIGTDQLLLKTGNAIPHLRRAYSLATLAEEKTAARLQLAEALLDQNEMEEAINLFQDEFMTDPASARAHLGLGIAAMTRNNREAAIVHLASAVTSPYCRQKAAALLATCHTQLGHAAQATEFARQATLPPADLPWSDPFDAEHSKYQLGQKARENRVNQADGRGRTEDVMALLEEIARTHPDDPTQVARAAQSMKQGDNAGAEKACREALAINPDNAVARGFLGIALYFQALERWNKTDRAPAVKLLEAASIELKRSIELKPDLGYSHLHLGYAYQKMGQLPEAAAAFRTAIAVTPYNPQAHLALGELLIEQGQSREAISHLDTAVRLAPANRRAKELLAVCREKQK